MDSAPWKLIDFVAQFRADEDAGLDLPLSHYLALFPRHEAEVAREFLALTGSLRRGDCVDLREIDAGSSRSWIGGYRVIREIGRGGQGVVFLAEDEAAGREVALKVLRSVDPFGDSDLSRERFVREAEIAARLEHPAICGVVDTARAGELTYLAMPFVPGETLERLIDRCKMEKERHVALPGKCAPLDLIETLARALHVAHEAGIAHRDIKPGNVMVTPDGEPVILDFGLASDAESASLTATGDRCGTPAYMAPEQVRGDRAAIDRRADVWALGIVAYECLTLRRPFAAPTREGLYEAIRSQEPSDPRRARPELPRDLTVILQTALEKSPARRYATALDFAEDLRRLRGGATIQARPPSPATLVKRWALRRPIVAVLCSAAALLLVSALAVTLYFLSVERELLAAERNLLASEREVGRAERAHRSTIQKRYQDVRSFAHKALFEFHEAIAELPGSLHARELVVRRAQGYLEKLQAEQGDDPGLQRELLAAFIRIGDIQGNPRVANLGDRDGALQSFERANALALGLLEKAPDDVRLRLEHAMCLARMAVVASVRDGISQGVERFVRARVKLMQLREQIPSQRDVAEELVRLQVTLSRAYLHDFRYADAERELRMAVDLGRQLADGSDADALIDFAGAQYLLGDALRNRGDATGALAWYEAAVAAVERARREGNTTAIARQVGARALIKIGRARVASGAHDAGVACLARAVETQRVVAEANPRDRRAQGLCAEACLALGDAVLDREPARALSLFERANMRVTGLPSESDLTTRGLAADVKGGLARAHAAVGDHEKALAVLRGALEDWRGLCAADESVVFHYGRAKCLVDAAHLATTVRQFAAAADWLDQADAVVAGLAGARPHDPRVARLRARVVLRRGSFAKASRDWPAALGAYGSVLAMGDQVRAEDRLKAARGRAQTLFRMQRWEDAIAAYGVAITAGEAVAASRPSDVWVVCNLGYDSHTMGYLWRRSGQPARAVAFHEKAVAAFEAVVEGRGSRPADMLLLAHAVRAQGTTRSELVDLEGASASLMRAMELFRAVAEASRATPKEKGTALAVHAEMLETHYSAPDRQGGHVLPPSLDGKLFAQLGLHEKREEPSATLLANHAWALLRGYPEGLRRPERALALARRATAIEQTCETLDVLTVALLANGERERAAATAKAAYRALAADTPSGLRTAIEQRWQELGAANSGG